MEAEEVLRCKEDAAHAVFDCLRKRCGVCQGGLQKKCCKCNQMVSYSNFAKHAKQCKSKKRAKPEEEKPIVRIAYVSSAWNLGDGVMPSGQYCSKLHEDFPDHLQKLDLSDPTGDMVIADAYDAIWGTMSASGLCELVKTFHSLDEVFDWHDKVDLLVVGNWAHSAALADPVRGRDMALALHHRLQELEIREGLRIFPPLDYVWYFAQKVHYYNKLSCMPLPSEVHTIPMIAVSSGQTWKKRLQVFAETHGATELVLKREMSEMSKHVKRTHVNALQLLEGRTSGFHWMAQPALVEFQEQPEFRMFVIDGQCRWGVATRFIGGGESGVVLQKEACAPGRQMWDAGGGKEAAFIAEQVVRAVSADMVHSGKFLRVDMVKQRHGWWINELEYFGNAFIHFESFDNSSEMLDQVIECVCDWMKQLVKGEARNEEE